MLTLANARRGEVVINIDGQCLTLRLTLGALAEIEQHFGVDDLTALGEKFAAARLSARDIVAIIASAARGGGSAISSADIAAMPADRVTVFVEAIIALFAANFGVHEASKDFPR